MTKRKKMKELLKKFLKKLIILLLLLMVVYNLIHFITNILNVRCSFFGISLFVVDSNSMKPTLNQKDLMIIKKIKANNLEQNDIIVYIKDENYRVTKIININENKGNLSYVIKGDNNYYAEEILSNTIYGKMIAKIHMGGIFINILQSKVLTIIIFIYIILIYRHRTNVKLKKKNRKKLKRRMQKEWFN